MFCYIKHKLYEQFAEEYGDEGVNLVYSQTLNIPLVEDVEKLKPELQRQLAVIRQKYNKEKVVDNLKKIFGEDLPEKDILFLADLGPSLAEFRHNGQIVFNSLELQNNGIEYHEAFHRIFRMYMNSEERNKIYKEVRKLNPNKPWTKFERKTEEEQIEELLANDFMLYTLEGSKKYGIIEKFFLYLNRLIRELFSRPKKLEKVYNDILNGKYIGNLSKDQLSQSAHSLKIDYLNSKRIMESLNINETERKAIIDTMVASFANNIFLANDPTEALKDNAFLEQITTDIMFRDLASLSGSELADLIKQNFFTQPDGIRKYFISKLKEIGLQLDFKSIQKSIGERTLSNKINPETGEVEQATSDPDQEINEEDKQGLEGNDISAFDTPAYMIDPTKTMSVLVRLKLSTLVKSNEFIEVKLNNGSVRMPKYYTFRHVWKSVAKNIAKAPADIDAMLMLLNKNLNNTISDQLREFLSESKVESPKFVSEFVATMSKTNYEFGRIELREGGFSFVEISYGKASNSFASNWAKELRVLYQKELNDALSFDTLFNKITKPGILSRVFAYFDVSYKESKEVTDAIYSIFSADSEGTISMNDFIKLLTSYGESKDLDNMLVNTATVANINSLRRIKGKLNAVLSEITSNYGAEETMHRTIEGEMMYDISFDTSLSRRFKTMQFINSLITDPASMNFKVDISLEELRKAVEVFTRYKNQLEPENSLEYALEQLKANYPEYTPYLKLILLAYYEPSAINGSNFVERYKDGKKALHLNSEIIKRMMDNGNESALYVIDGIEDKVSFMKKAVSLGDLNNSDLIVYLVNNKWNGYYDTTKHSDRSTFYLIDLTKKTAAADKKPVFFNFTPDNETTAVKDTLEEATRVLMRKLLNSERNYYKNQKDSYLMYSDQYFQTDKKGNLKMRSGFQGMITNKDLITDIKELFDTEGDMYFRYESGKMILEINGVPTTNEKHIRTLEQISSSLYTWLNNNTVNENLPNSFKNILRKNNILDDNYKTTRRYSGKRGDDSLYFPLKTDVDFINSFVDTLLFHYDEQLTLYGHYSQYKGAADFYKRMNTHSGTGETFDISSVTNKRIAEEFTNLDYTLFDLNGQEYRLSNYKYAPGLEESQKPILTLMSINENEAYTTRDINKFKEDLDESLKYTRTLYKKMGLSEQRIDEIFAKNKARYEKPLSGMNIADGQSYINLFAFKEYKERLGKWNEDLENLFNFEMSLYSIPNLTRERVAEEMFKFFLNLSSTKINEEKYNLESNHYSKIASQRAILIEQERLPENQRDNRVIEAVNAMIKKSEDLLKKETRKLTHKYSLQNYIEKYLHSIEVLKPQYGGTVSLIQTPNLGDNYHYGVVKTSFFPLLPSVIAGTNLHQLSVDMILSGTDVVSLQSATKIGAINYKLFGQKYPDREALETSEWDTLKKEGLEAYTKEGKYNSLISKVMSLATVHLDWKYLKDQVKIHSHPKSSITDSTQKRKNGQGNLFYKGEPIDYEGDNWSSLNEKEKLLASDVYRNYRKYSDTIRMILEEDLAELIEELSYSESKITDFSSLQKILLTAAKDRNSPLNIEEAIILFTDSTEPIIESLSNKNKIEPIIYKMVSKIISFKRPGNSVPMVSSHFFEPFNSDSKTSREEVSDVLSYYKIENDKVTPAEVMLPLPRNLFRKVISAMNKYNEANKIEKRYDNIIEALEQYNKLLASGEKSFELVAFRIPHQQYSSTEVLKVKRFFIPTLESFAVVYSEIVAKTGGD